MTTITCTTPGCKGTYEIHKNTRNLKRLLKLCKSCKKEHAKAYQRAWHAEHCKGKPGKKRGGPRDMKPKPDRPESPRAIWGRTHVCKVCGRNPYPNHWFCNTGCHARATRAAGDTETNAMPHVPMSGIN